MRRITLKNTFNEEIKLLINFDKLDDIRIMMILVIGGDEVLVVIKKDGSERVYDTGVKREFDEFNYKYILYDSKAPDFKLMDKFVNRKDSMEMKEWIKRRQKNEVLQNLCVPCK